MKLTREEVHKITEMCRVSALQDVVGLSTATATDDIASCWKGVVSALKQSFFQRRGTSFILSYPFMARESGQKEREGYVLAIWDGEIALFRVEKLLGGDYIVLTNPKKHANVITTYDVHDITREDVKPHTVVGAIRGQYDVATAFYDIVEIDKQDAIRTLLETVYTLGTSPHFQKIYQIYPEKKEMLRDIYRALKKAQKQG